MWGREGVGTHLRYVGEGGGRGEVHILGMWGREGVGTHLGYVGEGGGRYTS